MLLFLIRYWDLQKFKKSKIFLEMDKFGYPSVTTREENRLPFFCFLTNMKAVF